MNQILRLIGRARLRIGLGRLGLHLLAGFMLAFGAMAAVLLAQRVLGLTIDWWLAWTIALSVAVAGVAVSTWTRWPSRADAALELDERAGLRESLSTALAIRENRDAWSRAAVAQAQEKSARVRVMEALPLRAPRRWWAPLAPAAVFAVMWIALPQWDLLGRIAEAERAQAERDQRLEAASQVKEIEQEMDRLLSGVEEAELPEPPEAPEGDGERAEPENPDEIRRAAIKRLTALGDRLSELRRGDKGERLDRMAERMRNLRRPGPGPMDDVVKAMQQGDFKAASDRLRALMDKMAAGELSPEQQEALRKQMEQLAEQMRRLAEQREALERELREAGLDPSLATDPEALRRALQNAEGLSQQQRDALQRAAEANQRNEQSMQQMAQGLENAAQCTGSGDKPGQMQGMGQMAGGLSEMEMLQQEMESLDAAMSGAWGKITELSECLGEGGGGQPNMLAMWNPNMSGKRGPGGGDFDAGSAPFNTEKKKAAGKDLGGPIIGTRLVEGEQIKGESRAEFTSAVSAGAAAAEEAIETKTAPREYHDALKHYFGRLEKQQNESGDAPPAEPPLDG